MLIQSELDKHKCSERSLASTTLRQPTRQAGGTKKEMGNWKFSFAWILVGSWTLRSITVPRRCSTFELHETCRSSYSTPSVLYTRRMFSCRESIHGQVTQETGLIYLPWVAYSNEHSVLMYHHKTFHIFTTLLPRTCTGPEARVHKY